MTVPKAQHWLPQLYLRAFCTRETEGDASRLWVFFREGPEEPRRMRPAEIAAQNYLYSPQAGDRTRDHTVEQKLGTLEGALGQIWPAVTTGTVDLDNQSVRRILALFVSTLYLRNPQRLADRKMIHRRIGELLGNETLPLQWSKNDFQKAFTLDILSEARRLAELLLPKRWAVVASDAPDFATCDAPVILQNAERAPLAFGVQGTGVHLALSPTRFLIIDDEDDPEGYYATKPGFAEAMNYQTWVAADRYLLSSRPSDSVLQEIMAFAEEHGLS